MENSILEDVSNSNSKVVVGDSTSEVEGIASWVIDTGTSEIEDVGTKVGNKVEDTTTGVGDINSVVVNTALSDEDKNCISEAEDSGNSTSGEEDKKSSTSEVGADD